MESWKLIAGYYILFHILFNHYLAWTSNPGYTTEIPSGMCQKICRKCNFQKPERAHHCSVCNKCVLLMGKDKKNLCKKLYFSILCQKLVKNRQIAKIKK